MSSGEKAPAEVGTSGKSKPVANVDDKVVADVDPKSVPPEVEVTFLSPVPSLFLPILGFFFFFFSFFPLEFIYDASALGFHCFRLSAATCVGIISTSYMKGVCVCV